MISIIIPAFNCEQTISNTLDSIDNQKILDKEVIVIDDGSMDNTKGIIKQYITKHPRSCIRYFWKKNAGVSSARNKGLDFAQGDYICFCDADDVLPQDALRSMLQYVADCDIVVGNYTRIDGTGLKRLIRSKYRGKTCAQAAFGHFFSGGLYISLWNAMFKKEIIDKYNIRFKDIPVGEDVNFIANYLLGCSNALCIDKTVYEFHYDKKRSIIRDTKFECKTIEESQYAGLANKAKNRGWVSEGKLLENGCIPVFSILQLFRNAYKSQSYLSYCEQLVEWENLILTAKMLKIGKVTLFVYIKARLLLSLFILCRPCFYVAAKKCYESLF